MSDLAVLRESASRFGARYGGAARLRRARDSGMEVDRQVWKELADGGFLGMRIPEELGGFCVPLEYATATAEEFGRALLAEPYLAVASLAASVICRGDGAALKERLLPAIAAGEVLAALAWEERTDSIVNSAVTTRVTRASDGERLSGRKRFVSPGSVADGFIVPAMQGEELIIYWIPVSSAGVRVSTARLADGGSVCDLTFDDVSVSDAAVICSPASSHACLRDALDEALILCSAELIGIAGKALDMTLEYLRVRQQFGRPIGSFQALQHRAVNMHIQLQLAEASLESALEAFSQDDPSARSLAASRVKARCSDVALAITREAIQMHGAVGFTDEYDIGLYLKRALTRAAWLGNASQQRRRYERLQREQGRAHA